MKALALVILVILAIQVSHAATLGENKSAPCSAIHSQADSVTLEVQSLEGIKVESSQNEKSQSTTGF